jgi:hypothetical protein|tara:strand:+ start:432 stop:920 length:489 start_codon:yes stop_codon:yes gene_type:complete
MLYRVTGYFKEEKITKIFDNLYNAIEFKDTVDAHYPSKVTFEKGVYPMREMVYNSWNGVMNMDVNPLKHIPDLQVRHLVLQILAWMWCIVFSMYIGSWVVMGISMVAHALLLTAIVITVGTFNVAKNNPGFFKKFPTSTPSRARTLWIEGKPYKDPYGGEHE